MLSERVRGQAGVRFCAIWFRCCGGTRKALAALCLGLGAEDAPFALGWEIGRSRPSLGTCLRDQDHQLQPDGHRVWEDRAVSFQLSVMLRRLVAGVSRDPGAHWKHRCKAFRAPETLYFSSQHLFLFSLKPGVLVEVVTFALFCKIY